MNLKFKFTLGNNIIIGLILGVLTGLFFGESCEVLGPVGSAFVALLQMSVLPYIVVSMIFGLGKLSYADAKKLALKGGGILGIFWLITLIFIMIIPVCFPNWSSSGFFSTSVVAPESTINYLEMYIPSNPFKSLANNVVPAVTLFSICFGVSLIGVKEKEVLLKNLDILSQSLCRITNMIVKLTPIGTFAIAANAAGSMTLDEFGRIQVYFITYIVACLLMSIIIIPLIVTIFTPFKYRDVMNLSKDALLTAFTTGNLFIILPIIAANIDSLFEKYNFIDEEDSSQSHVIIPIVYNFPNPGKLMALLFILFAGWYSGHQVGLLEMPSFMLTGLLALFGSSNSAIQYLLTQFQIPADMFEIYLVSGIINGKFGTMLAAMFIFCYTLITVVAISGKLKIHIFRLVLNCSIMLVATGVVFWATGYSIGKFIQNDDDTKRILAEMKISNPVKMVVHKHQPAPRELANFKPSGEESLLSQIKKRGVLRVAYNRRAVPFSFINAKGDLVGYDIEMMSRLAFDLGCTLEFYPYSYSNINELLDKNVVDIVVGGVSISGKRLQKMNFSHCYMQIHLALVTHDYNREALDTLDELLEKNPLTLAVIEGSYYREVVEKRLPATKFVNVKSQKEFFEQDIKADALLTSAEQGFPWTILYPEYTVVIPKPVMLRDFIAYPIKKGELEFMVFLNYWLELQKANGIDKELYNYWVLGKNIEKKNRRWSILENVLNIELKKKKQALLNAKRLKATKKKEK